MDNEFEDELFNKSYLLFGLFGVVNFLFNFDDTYETNKYFFHLVSFLLSVLIAIIFGFISSYILFKTGKILSGKATYLDIFAVLAYSFVPLSIGLLLILFFKDTYNLILYTSYLITLKILTFGLLKYNKYGILKTIVNISVLVAFFYLLYFILPHLVI
ncbi:hypothetical protein BTO06_05090 [Tenacibaculum sp. SZ-18]|nr:hypothetical protein BTO06_05090 [Tenacibaculum sp. SZ-18]